MLRSEESLEVVGRNVDGNMAIKRKITTRMVKARFKGIRNRAKLTRTKQSISKKTFGLVKPKKISDRVAKGARAIGTKSGRQGLAKTGKRIAKRIAKRTAIIGGVGAAAVGGGYIAGRRKRRRTY